MGEKYPTVGGVSGALVRAALESGRGRFSAERPVSRKRERARPGVARGAGRGRAIRAVETYVQASGK